MCGRSPMGKHYRNCVDTVAFVKSRNVADVAG
jgi:hypothetical protein